MDKQPSTLRSTTTWSKQDSPLCRSLSRFDTIVQAESDLLSTSSTRGNDQASMTKESTLCHEHGQPNRMPLRESLGFGGMAVIAGGTIGILGGYAFLTFLWFGHGSQEEASNATWVWRQLALRGYMNQAVTLTSLVLCAAVGLQATVCTSSTFCCFTSSHPPFPPSTMKSTVPRYARTQWTEAVTNKHVRTSN